MSVEANPLLQQFIPEARDLLEQASRSLLALEREPGETEPMNALFRAVHTLKGTSSLFEIGPLTRVVHAAEDLLCLVQSGAVKLSAEAADVLLEGLDQVGVWIEALAESGDLPETAAAVSAAWLGRFGEPLQAGAAQAQAPEDEPRSVPDWVATLPEWSAGPLGEALGADGAALLAVTYEPDAQCFFRGEDPLTLMRQIEGLRLLRVEALEPWPALDAIDPFLCNIRLRGIAAASPAELAHLFRYVPEQVTVAPLPARPGAAAAPGFLSAGAAPAGSAATSGLTAEEHAAVQDLLAGQARLLTAQGAEGSWPGRLGAAVRVLRGLAAYTRQAGQLAALDKAADHAAAVAAPGSLVEFIASFARALGAAPAAGAVAAAGPAAASGPRRETAAAGEAKPAGGAGSAAGPTTLRVEQSKIDALMNLIGELVVAKNALAYLARRAEGGTLTVRELAREIKDRQALVNRIAEDMQGAVMAVRMLPVDHVFQRFPRLVRDIARRLGKQVELVVEGGETEADKNVIEALADPLIHMVRNCLDHGLEPPAERAAAGKPAAGTIRLSAAQDSDRVVIQVRDDGRGIDPAVVRAKAVEKGLLDAERAAALSDEEAVMLVFAAGFSTAAAVSELSGRGVGMDVVRSAVEKLGGRVALTSRLGQGTAVELTLPLSMVVTRIMTVACGERMFGVPMALVVETVRVPRSALHGFRDREAFVLRDSVVPVVRLARLLDLPSETGGATQGGATQGGDAQDGDAQDDGRERGDGSDEEAILVVHLNGERLGVVVGAFREGMEVIVRPMEGVLAGLRGFSGTTLLGDGRVLLILDLRELVA